MDNVPPMNDPTWQSTIATPPRPCLARGYPSTAVITEEASPGTLIRMEVMAPPYIAPQ